VIQLGDGRLCSAGGDGTLRLWDADSGACTATLLGHERGVSSVIQLGDGRLCSGGFDGLRWWNLESGRCERWQIRLSDETLLRLDAGGATLDNLIRPWHSLLRDGRRLTADAELGRHCGFMYGNRWPLQPWRFPERVEWIELPQWPGEYRRLRLTAARGQDFQALLGRIDWHR